MFTGKGEGSHQMLTLSQARMVRFDLVARLGEADAAESHKQVDESNAPNKVRTSARALHPKPHLEKSNGANVPVHW